MEGNTSLVTEDITSLPVVTVKSTSAVTLIDRFLSFLFMVDTPYPI